MRRIVATVAVLLVLATVAVPGVGAATAFHGPAIESQWRTDEGRLLNFWGPLRTAQEFGQSEPYREAPGGKRNVQYFDKGRMEDTNGMVTSGLLATDLITGKMQVGDATFETRSPARVQVAGDSDSTGPTYADMAKLPEFYPKPNGGIDRQYLLFRDGDFAYLPRESTEEVVSMARTSTDSSPVATYGGDPAMRYGQFVFQPFHEFIATLPNGLSRVGYPIRPYFMADVKIDGATTRVMVQAFERRILTYNPKNPAASRVEFGNIGQHYQQWRAAAPATTSTTQRATPAADFTPFAKRWGRDGYQFVVKADGNAQEDYRTYIDCSDSNPEKLPCEKPFTSYAGRTVIRFTEVTGRTAYGRILSSNDPRVRLEGVRLTLTPYDTVELAKESGGATVLCGPDYPRLAPPNVRSLSPCGA